MKDLDPDSTSFSNGAALSENALSSDETFASDRTAYASWRSFLLLIGLVTISATKLRFSHFPIGVSEICLALFIGITFLRCKLISFDQPAIKMILALIAISVAGLIWNYFFIHNINSTITHTLLAYLFCFTLLVAIHNADISIDKLIFYVALGTVIFNYLLYWFYPGIWYVNRFAGMAANPNQLALCFVAIPFVLIYFFKRVSAVERLLILACLGILYYLAMLTETAAIWCAWLLVAGVFLLIESLQLAKRFAYARQVLICFYIIVLLASMIYLIMHFSYIIEHYLKGEDAYMRIILWLNAFKVIFISPLVGLGPGSFISFPHQDLTGNFEAHNTFMDVIVQSGLLGLTAYVGFLYYGMKHLWTQRGLLYILLAVIAFSCFHFVLRQPLVWVYFLWVYSKITHPFVRSVR